MRELLPSNTNASPAADKVIAVDVVAPLPVTVASVSDSYEIKLEISGGVYEKTPVLLS